MRRFNNRASFEISLKDGRITMPCAALGPLVVHRPVNEAGDGPNNNRHAGWRVSHAATGLSVDHSTQCNERAARRLARQLLEHETLSQVFTPKSVDRMKACAADAGLSWADVGSLVQDCIDAVAFERR